MRQLAFLLLISLFAGCGQTGPLYMPGEPPPPAEPASTNTSAVGTEEEEDAVYDESGEDEATENQD